MEEQALQEQVHIRAVIFDLGGVILRTEDAQPREQLAARYGMSRATLEETVFNNPTAIAAEAGQVSLHDAWAETARRLGVPMAEMDGFFTQFFGGDRVDFSLLRFVQNLRPARTTVLLSNTWQVDLPRFLSESLRIPDTFDIVISSAARKIRKPDPQIFRLALELAGVEPQETVFVDDFARNIEAAAALGLRVVHFRTAEQAVAELRAMGVQEAGKQGGAP